MDPRSPQPPEQDGMDAANEHGDLGDTSTLADPAVVDDLVDNRMNR